MKYHHCLVVSQRRKIEDHEGYKGLRMMRERERERDMKGVIVLLLCVERGER
jgi:hypothetical protein